MQHSLEGKIVFYNKDGTTTEMSGTAVIADGALSALSEITFVSKSVARYSRLWVGIWYNYGCLARYKFKGLSIEEAKSAAEEEFIKHQLKTNGVISLIPFETKLEDHHSEPWHMYVSPEYRFACTRSAIRHIAS